MAQLRFEANLENYLPEKLVRKLYGIAQCRLTEIEEIQAVLNKKIKNIGIDNGSIWILFSDKTWLYIIIEEGARDGWPTLNLGSVIDDFSLYLEIGLITDEELETIRHGRKRYCHALDAHTVVQRTTDAIAHLIAQGYTVIEPTAEEKQ